LAAALAEHHEDVLLYRRLATLRTDVPLVESVDDLKWRGAGAGALTGLAAAIIDDWIARRATALSSARH
jgi:hypothetical protein